MSHTTRVSPWEKAEAGLLGTPFWLLAVPATWAATTLVCISGSRMLAVGGVQIEPAAIFGVVAMVWFFQGSRVETEAERQYRAAHPVRHGVIVFLVPLARATFVWQTSMFVQWLWG